MKAGILIKGGRVVDPAGKTDGVADVLIEGGKISSIGEGISARGAGIIDACGKIVCPGLIDMHAHLREPGREDEETIETGTRAAVHGGYCAVACMPNTDPPVDNAGIVKFILDSARSAGYARVLPVGCITRGLKGKELADMGELVSSGAVAVSDDGEPVASSRLMRSAMEYSKMFAIPVISHCEDKTLHAGVMNEGLTSALLGLPGIPSAAEDIMVARDLLLAALTGAHLHIAHVSTAGAVELIRRAKSEGINVTAETAPHYFSLTDESVASFNTNLRINPPLRSPRDLIAVKEGLKDGTIDVIATDHAPHAQVEKEEEFALAPPGTTGLETCLSVVIKELVEPGMLDFSGALSKLSLNPAKILNIEGGALGPGKPADICIFDPGKSWKVSEDAFFSKSRNSAFLGNSLKGSVETVIISGKIVFTKGKFCADS